MENYAKHIFLPESQPGNDKEVVDLSGKMTSQGRRATAQILPVRKKGWLLIL